MMVVAARALAVVLATAPGDACAPRRAERTDEMRRFVVIGQTATASPSFSLLDIPGTSGRLDVLLRCLRAALLVSHGLRRDTQVYLVLQGGAAAPRVLRFDGGAARFVRPDERSLATLVQKSLAVGDAMREDALRAGAFVEVRPGVALCQGGLAAVLADVGPCTSYVLAEGAADVRASALELDSPVFFVGDHRGFEASTAAALAAFGAAPRGLGPVSLHAEDAITLVVNELDRRAHDRAP